MPRILFLTLATAGFWALPVAGSPQTGALDFEAHVRPILKANCFQCHGEDGQRKGRLDVRLRRLLVQGGRSGPALVPGNPEASLIYLRLQRGEMPPGKKKLTAAEVDIVRRWIWQGARVLAEEPVKIGPGPLFTATERAFWSLQPVRRPTVPAFTAADGVRTPVDAFLLVKLREKRFGFAPGADRATLLRRASLDLLGLLPTPAEVDAFLADTAPDAWERAVDRLLASPHYGERWGRHWLDVAGYADSEGGTADDVSRPDAWKYRGWVIRTFQADMPLDEFIRQQVAGDEMVRPPYATLSAQNLDKLIATGFLRMAPDGTGNDGQVQARHQVVGDTLKIVSSAFLGLTVGCAQCHDHRFDPIAQADYYRLRAIFEPAFDTATWRVPAARRISLYTELDRKKVQEIEAAAGRIVAERQKKLEELIARALEKELKKLPEQSREPIRHARAIPVAKQTPAQKQLLKDHPSVNVTAGSLYLYDPTAVPELKKFDDRAAAVRAKKPVEHFLRALTEIPGHVPPTRLLQRGDPSQPGEVVAPGGLSVLDERFPLQPAAVRGLPTSGRRLAFAQWLTSGRHPLTARVLVNRVWMHHFGKGLVATPGDFGALGERPSHPELLDWLADDFMAGGWRLKRLHRLLLTSTAYRQSSQRRPGLNTIDPDNRLLGRMSVRRLEAETLRDVRLAISGRLNRRMFGPPIPVRPDEVGQIVIGRPNKVGNDHPGPMLPMHGEDLRRSIYIEVRRSQPLAVLDTFDGPAMAPNCETRNSSTVATQALLLLNSAGVREEAAAFADRLLREEKELSARIDLASRLAFSRSPESVQRRQALTFLEQQTALFRTRRSKDVGDPAREALIDFCQALLSANGSLYVD
jgi:mono/diheme cytochrome c family protein